MKTSVLNIVAALATVASLGVAVRAQARVTGWVDYGGDKQNSGRSAVALQMPLRPKMLWTNTVPENVTFYRARPVVRSPASPFFWAQSSTAVTGA